MNKFAPGCTCCSDCILAEDDFDRSDSTSIGSAWVEVAGNAEIASNVLKLNTNSTVSYVLASPDNVARVVKVLVKAGANGDIARIHLGNTNDTTKLRMIAELEFAAGVDNATLRIIEWDGAVETIRRECNVTATSGNWYTLWFGHNVDDSTDAGAEYCHIHFESDYQFGFLHLETGTSPSRYVALESIAGTAVEFDDFSIERTDDPAKNCPKVGECCWPNVFDPSTVELEVELSGFTNRVCLTCADANGTYTLTNTGYSPSNSPTCPAMASGRSRCGCWEYKTGVGTCAQWDYIRVSVGNNTSNNRCWVYAQIVRSTGALKGEGIHDFSSTPMTECDLNGWVTISGWGAFGTDCQGAQVVKVRVKP